MKAAVIGLGRIGWGLEKDPLRKKPCTHVGVYLASPKTELVAVADIDKSKLEAFKQEHPEISTYVDYEVMLNREKPDIISICTPTETHCKIARNCARFNSTKVLWVEKPLASTVEESEKMIKTCDNFGTKLACNMIRRWDPAYRLIKGILDGEDKNWNIGELLTFSGVFSGDPVNDGVHMADLYNFLGQKNTKLSLLNVPTPYLVWDIDLVGSDGWISLRRNGEEIQLWFPEDSHRYFRLRELGRMTHIGGSYDFSQAMMIAVADLVECAETYKQPECTGYDGLEALRLIQVCIEKTGG